MRRTEQRQGQRKLKLRDVLRRVEVSELSQLGAAELLGMSERTFRRWAHRFGEEGEDGLVDRRLGRCSGRAVPSDAADHAPVVDARPSRLIAGQMRLEARQASFDSR